MPRNLHSAKYEDVCGIIEYTRWKRAYQRSGRTGALATLFSAVFDVSVNRIVPSDPHEDPLERDLQADGIIRSNLCFDDLVNDPT